MRTFSLSFCGAKLQIIPENQAISHDYFNSFNSCNYPMRYPSPVFLLDTRAFLGQMVKHFLHTPILIDHYSLKLIKLKQVIKITFNSEPTKKYASPKFI